MISAWRLVKKKRAAAAFSGAGARIAGGRWNRPGTTVVYVSEALSLAVLELFVHLDAASRARLKLVAIPVEIPESIVEQVQDLPPDWRSEPPPESTMKLGTSWANRGRSTVLRVPSAIVPVEFNMVINPAQPGFEQVKIGKPMSFSLDPRMWK